MLNAIMIRYVRIKSGRKSIVNLSRRDCLFIETVRHPADIFGMGDGYGGKV